MKSKYLIGKRTLPTWKIRLVENFCRMGSVVSQNKKRKTKLAEKNLKTEEKKEKKCCNRKFKIEIEDDEIVCNVLTHVKEILT